VRTLVAALAVAASGCGNRPDEMTIVGSTALLPLAAQATADYSAAHRDARIDVSGGGSGVGLAEVENGVVDIGMSDIAAPKTSSDLVDNRVAIVGFAVVVRSGAALARVKNLTSAQLRAIFSGAIGNWRAVGGPDLPITVINRPRSSGTRGTFTDAIMHATPYTPRELELDSNGAVVDAVARSSGAIAYVSFAYAGKAAIRTLTLDGAAPTPQQVRAHRYPLWSFEHMYTKGPPRGLARAYIDFVLTPAYQRTTVARLGYVPVR